MKRISLLIMVSVLSVCMAWAQKLTTSQPVYDCGQVAFRSPVTVKFSVKNPTNRPIAIKEVLTSCGCTTATAKKTRIASGRETTVNVTYDANQLGHFQKSIWVYEDGQDNPLELTIKGVVAADIQDFSASYPYTLDQIRTDQNVLEFDDVNRGTTPIKTINILNTTGSTIDPVVMHLPDYLQATVTPSRIAPNKQGVISFTLLSEKVRDMGLTQTSVYVGKKAGEKVSSDKELPISIILLPSVETTENAPAIQLSHNIIMKSQMQGKAGKLKTEILVKNTGASELEIKSLQMFTSGMQLSLGKMKLLPNESTKLKVQIDEAVIKQSKQRPRILMITNDPRRPKIVIEVQ